MLNRLFIFLVFGLFVFSPDVSRWWAADSVTAWYGNYIPWLLVIAGCYWIQYIRNRPPE
ncbi:MAG: hypothetical protein KDI36_07970 [Pseudomonadales bacterium]|nr:hypothetical protein [Pseudomonadales bacterium]